MVAGNPASPGTDTTSRGSHTRGLLGEGAHANGTLPSGGRRQSQLMRASTMDHVWG